MVFNAFARFHQGSFLSLNIMDFDPVVVWSPREFNTVADFYANAAMDAKAPWQWTNPALFKCIARNGGSFRLCVDGGLRGLFEKGPRPGAMACAVYCVDFERDAPTYVPVLFSAMSLHGIKAAFEAEAMALEWSITLWRSFL